MSFRNYSFDKVSLTWLGLDLTTGLAEGTPIQEAKANARWSLTMGAKGRGTRSKNSNRNGTLTITVDQSSQLHLTLIAIAKADDASHDKVGPVVMRDRSSGQETVYENAFIEDVPDESRGQAPGTFSWVFIYEKKDPKTPVKPINIIGT